MASGDRPARAHRRHGLVGPLWLRQPGPVPIQPSELSGPPTCEHHRLLLNVKLNTVRPFESFSKLFLFLEIIPNFKNLYKLVGMFKNYKINFVWIFFKPLFTVGLTKLKN
jgi:hypothetical protein